MCEFIEFIKLLLVPLLAVFGAWMAWHQYILSRNKLRLEWYDKRFQVYQGVEGLLLYLVVEARLPLEELQKFRIRTAQSTFLFDNSSGIDEFLKLIDTKAVKLYELSKRTERLPLGVEKNQLASEETELLGWFGEQSTVSQELFGNYLRPIEPNWDALGRVRKLFTFVKCKGNASKLGR